MDLTLVFDVSMASWSSQKGLVVPEVLGLEQLKASDDEFTWIALTSLNVELAKEILRKHFGFHPVAIEDALSDSERPGMYVDEDYVFVTLPVIEQEGNDFSFTHIGLFVCAKVLVSVTQKGCGFISEWFERWKTHPKEVGITSDMLMHELIDAAVDDYFPALDAMQNEVDQLEEAIYEQSRLNVAAALNVRRKLLEMRRQITPIRDILNGLLRRDTPVIRHETRTYLQDVYDHTLRALESLDLDREILSSIMDAQISIQSNRLNEVMRNMTSIATILMVLALIPGVYGMNFRYMPELEHREGYYLVLISMAVVFVLGLIVASKIGWLTVNWPWDHPKKEDRQDN